MLSISSCLAILSLLSISSVSAANAAMGPGPHPINGADYNHADVPYKNQEDAFFNSENPRYSAGAGKNAKRVYFLLHPNQFNVHKSTFFSRISRAEQVEALKEYFFNYSNETIDYAKLITSKDVEAISSKHANFSTCDHFAELLMGAPSNTLSGMSPECASAVAVKAQRYTQDATNDDEKNDFRQLALQFAKNTPKLNNSVWSKHAETLFHLSNTPTAQVLDSDDDEVEFPSETPIDTYNKYGDRLRYLIQNPDLCAKLNAERFLSDVTTKQASLLTRGTCFASMQGISTLRIGADEKDKQRHLQKLPAEVFAEFDGTLDESVFKYLRAEQISKWNVKANVGERCANLRVDLLARGKHAALTRECLQSFLKEAPSTTQYAPRIGSGWRAIKPDLISQLDLESFMRIDPEDFVHLNNKAVNAYLEKNPEICSEIESVDTEKVRLNVPQCANRLSADQITRAIDKQRSAFPAAILAQFNKETVEKLSGQNWTQHLTGDQIRSLGRDIKNAEEHPCAAIPKDDFINNEKFLKNVSETCFGAFTFVDELDGNDLNFLPPSFSTLLPYSKLMSMLGDNATPFFEKLDETGLKNLVGKDFCKEVGKENFSAIPEKTLISVDAKCAAALTFKKELSQKQVRAFPAPAFKLFDKTAAAEIKLTDLTPDQFEQLSADVPKENNAGANLTKDVLTALPATHTAKLSKPLLEATPVGALAAFDTKEKVAALPPKSLNGLIKDQVAAIPCDAMSGFTATQIQELGTTTTDLAKHPLHLFTDEHHKKHFSKETLELAAKRLEEETKRINGLNKNETKAASGAMSSGVSALALTGLAIAMTVF